MPARSEEFRDRFLGAVLGLAVGDALGSPWARATHYEIDQAYPGGEIEMKGGGRSRLRAGEATGQTAAALSVMEAYSSSRGFDAQEIVWRLLDAKKVDRRGLDAETLDIYRELAERPEIWQTQARDRWLSTMGTLCGNGALVRCAPVALATLGDTDRMIRETTAVCQMTHFDPRCNEAAIAVNFLLSQCVMGAFRPDIIKLCDGFIENLRSGPIYQETIANFDPGPVEDPGVTSPLFAWREDKDAVPALLTSIKGMKREDLHSGSLAVHTLGCASWALVNAKSFKEGVNAVVALGGDADRQGALTGALLGARFGLSGIPAPWLAPLNDRARMTTIAEQLLATVSVSV